MRDPGGDGDHYTAVIALPAYPTPERTMQSRGDAISATFSGTWQNAVDLYRGTVEEDLFFWGILRTMADGILGMSHQFTGDPRTVSALLDQDSTPGDDAIMHPSVECSRIFSDGMGLGIGLGQNLLTCWRCAGTEWSLIKSATLGGDTGNATVERAYEVCERCDAYRFDRPYDVRELWALQHRDPRWLWRNPLSKRWHFTGRNGLVPFTPGDGEWFLFQTVPDQDPWRFGLWIPATIAAIFARDSVYDRQAISAISMPMPIFESEKPSNPDTRAEAERKAKELSFQNRLVIPWGWKFRIEQARVDYVDVADRIVAWGSDGFEVALTGNVMGRKAQSAFTDAGIYKRTTEERRAFYAGAWARAKREQNLRWYVRETTGSGDLRRVPVESIDVRSPEDKLSEAKSLGAWGDAFKAYQAGLAAHGLEADPADLVELAQRIGRRVRAKPGNASTSKLPLGVEATMALVSGAEGKSALGLKPFGDDRDAQTIAQLQAAADAQPPAVSPTRPRRRARRP